MQPFCSASRELCALCERFVRLRIGGLALQMLDLLVPGSRPREDEIRLRQQVRRGIMDLDGNIKELMATSKRDMTKRKVRDVVKNALRRRSPNRRFSMPALDSSGLW
jgi:hypothetical protein